MLRSQRKTIPRIVFDVVAGYVAEFLAFRWLTRFA